MPLNSRTTTAASFLKSGLVFPNFQDKRPLQDGECRSLAEKIPCNAVESFALIYLKIDDTKVKNLKSAHGHLVENVSKELLILWRNKSRDNNRQVGDHFGH